MTDTNIDATIATPNPSMTKESPINFAVSAKVIALMMKINSPNVNSVIGKVKMNKIGRTIKFKIDKTMLAINAVLKSSIWNESNNCATAKSAIAFKNTDVNQLRKVRVIY